jgi:hypothetical protein
MISAWDLILLSLLLGTSCTIIWVAFNYREVWALLEKRFWRRMGCFIIFSLILAVSVLGEEDIYPITEDPPLFAVDPLDEALPVVEAIEPPQPIIPPAFPRATEIILSIMEPQDISAPEGINWTEFYSEFKPLEINLTKNITMLRA